MSPNEGTSDNAGTFPTRVPSLGVSVSKVSWRRGRVPEAEIPPVPVVPRKGPRLSTPIAGDSSMAHDWANSMALSTLGRPTYLGGGPGAGLGKPVRAQAERLPRKETCKRAQADPLKLITIRCQQILHVERTK